MSASSRDALRQLDQFWSMLDELSENDPAAYRSFIDKQMKEGAQYTSPPEIHTSLRTEILVRYCRIHVLGMCFFACSTVDPGIHFHPNTGAFNQGRVVGGNRKFFFKCIYLIFHLKIKCTFVFFSNILTDKLLLNYILF